MSHRSFQVTFVAVLLTVTSVLAACSSSKAPDAPLSSAGGSTASSHPEWSQYTFTIGDNGGDGSEELSKVTGAFDDTCPAIEEARHAIIETAPNQATYKARLVDYNSDPTTTLADIQKLLQLVEERLSQRLAK